MMKFRTLTHVTLMISSVALLAGAETAAQDSSIGEQVAYSVVGLATLGGTSGTGNTINDRNWPMGSANLAGNQSAHATIWLEGLTFDLGTLGGPNSGVEWPVKNNQGVISGIAETSTANPLGESWSCSAFFPAVTGDI